MDSVNSEGEVQLFSKFQGGWGILGSMGMRIYGGGGLTNFQDPWGMEGVTYVGQ